MKLYEKLILLGLKILASLTTFVFPIVMLYNKLIIGQSTKAIVNFSVAFFMLGLFLIWILWLRRIYFRKLDAIATVEEMGQNTQTNFVIVRVLKTMEYVLPFAFLALFMKGLSYLQVTPQAVFVNILWFFLGGFLIFLAHDAIKNHYINKQIIRMAIKLDDDKAVLRAKMNITISQG